MALCLAESITDCQGFDAQDQAKKYISWSRDGYMSSVPERGCFDIGVGTRLVLMAWRSYFKENGCGKGGSEVARAPTEEGLAMINSKFGDENYCGNGSLMRVAPVALAYHATEIERASQLAMESSKVTHPHLRCQEACALYTQVTVKALRGSDKEALAKAVVASEIQDEPLRNRLSTYQNRDSWIQQSEINIKSTGYVIDTLEAALWAFFSTDTFEDGAISAVSLGEDADTVAAVYGALAGAFYGLEAIPSRWMRAMRQKELLQKVSEGLEALNGNAGHRV